MERRFNAPLGDVRVHTGPAAATTARAEGAQAFAQGNDVVFGDRAGASAGVSTFAPHTDEGRSLLAHELTHVVQFQRFGAPAAQGEGAAPVQRSVADGGARRDKPGSNSAEHEAESNAHKVKRNEPLTVTQAPAAKVQRNILGDAADWVGDRVDDAVELVGDALRAAAMAVVRRVAPSLAPIIEQGPVEWLKGKIAGAFEGITSALNAINPMNAVRALVAVFGGLIKRAGNIMAALASGDCKPLLEAIGELKDFVVDVAESAWEKLTDFVAPIGDFFSNLWSGYGAPAVQWLSSFAGDVWDAIKQFATDIWDWTQPIRDVAGRVWNWVKGMLFGDDDESTGESSGGLINWVKEKAESVWNWIKEETRPVWEPIAGVVHAVADLIPFDRLTHMGEQMHQLSTDLGSADGAVADGDGVAENRETLSSVLPSVSRVMSTLRGVISSIGGWLVEKVGAFGELVTGFMGSLRSSSWFSWLAGLLGWLEDGANALVGWVQQGLNGLFDLILGAFDALTPFVEALAGVVNRFISFLGDVMSIAQLVLSSVWEAIPCCIREPIKNFVVNTILARIPVFGQFFTDPTLWPRVRATAMHILHQVFVDGDLAGAAWSFFQAVLRILGLPPELVVQVLAKAAQAIGDILTDPIGFLINLLGAVKKGFGLFFDNIGTHLLNGVSGWLFGQAQDAGITPPTDFSLRSILSFVLEVLGITVEHIFERLAAKLDPQTVARLRTIVRVATGVWRFVSILITDGPAGLWEEIQSQLSNLWDTVLNGVIGWVQSAVIDRAVRWLMSLLDVTGIMPVINTLIAVYNAIESFMQYLREMLEIVSKVLDGIIDIAHGSLDTAAGFLETALDHAMPVAIGFLANQFGLGRIGERMHELLETVRATVDRGIDWLLDRAIAGGQALIALARRGVAAVRGWWQERHPFHGEDGEDHNLYFEGTEDTAELTVASAPKSFSVFLNGLPDSPDKTLAQTKFTELRDLRRESRAARTAGTAAASGNTDEFSARIGTLVEEIGTIAGRLMKADSTVSTPPVFGSVTSHGWGRSVSVTRLTADRSTWPVRGGEPSVTSPAWQRLGQRRTDGNAGDYMYVRGHLLNHNLDGPGNSWENLAPITQDANNRLGTSMLHAFETPVKDAVAAGGHARNFRVTMNYNQASRNPDLNKIDKALAAGGLSAAERRRLQTTREVIEEERYVPSSVDMSAALYDASGKKTRDLSVPTPNMVRTADWDRYTVA
jgi:phage-related protein